MHSGRYKVPDGGFAMIKAKYALFSQNFRVIEYPVSSYSSSLSRNYSNLWTGWGAKIREVLNKDRGV